MPLSTRTLVLSFILLGSHAVSAQPYQFGCHYFRTHPGTAPVPTAEQRELIDDIIARSDTFNILHYDIAIDVTDYTGQQLKAATTVTYTPLMAGQDFIRFELMGLEVDSVTSPQGPLAFAHDGQTLRVDFAAPPAMGDTGALTVHYHGHPERDPEWGGFYFESGYIYNLGIGLSSIPPNFGKVWYPCFDSFVERATYTYHVKSAGTFRAHCQGDFLGETALGGDTVVRTFTMDQDIPTHLSAIAVADYRDSNLVHTGAYGDIPVRLTAKPSKLNAMVDKFADIGGAIDALEFWYGPYGWQRVGYVLTTDGALEIPTNIAYPDFMTSQGLFENRGLFSHELGHHWWGDMVTPLTQQDMWLKEGPAEYSGHLVEEWLFGEEVFQNVVRDNHYYVLRQAHVQDGGFQPLSPMPDPYIYGLTTYYKGASVMHNLRGYLGDTLFRQGMQDVQVQHAYGNLDAAGFRDALEASTGYDLDPFFDGQVFAPGFSVFVVQSLAAQPSGGSWAVDLVVKQKLRGTDVFHEAVPLDITLVGADGQRQEYREPVGGEYTALALNCAFEPVSAILNGHGKLNQARTDIERTLLPGVALSGSQPRVDFRLTVEELADTATVRIEHIWAAPEADMLGAGVSEISGTHYWIVDGLWPAGTLLSGRVSYAAQPTYSLDHDMLGTDESGVMLLYRANALQPWEVYAHQTVNANILTNGTGYIDIDTLLQGQYAFGKGVFTGIAAMSSLPTGLQVQPVPAKDRLSVHGLAGVAGPVRLAVFDARGAQVLERSLVPAVDGRAELDVSALVPGAYVRRATAAGDAPAGRAFFLVAR